MSYPPQIQGVEIRPMSELEKWATPRLLRFFKRHRRKLILIRERGAEDREEVQLLEYLDGIQHILNEREHVTK